MESKKNIQVQEPRCNPKRLFYLQFLIIFALGILYYGLNLTIYYQQEQKYKIGLQYINCGQCTNYYGVTDEDKSRLNLVLKGYLILFIINVVIMSFLLLFYVFNHLGCQACCGLPEQEDCHNYCVSYYMALSCLLDLIFGLIDAAYIIMLKYNSKWVVIDNGTVAAFIIRSLLCFLAILYFFTHFKQLVKCDCWCEQKKLETNENQQIQIELQQNHYPVGVDNYVPVKIDHNGDKKVPSVIEIHID